MLLYLGIKKTTVLIPKQPRKMCQKMKKMDNRAANPARQQIRLDKRTIAATVVKLPWRVWSDWMINQNSSRTLLVSDNICWQILPICYSSSSFFVTWTENVVYLKKWLVLFDNFNTSVRLQMQYINVSTARYLNCNFIIVLHQINIVKHWNFN